ncbi:hypothetical protein GIB67_029375 [Kingdonia uniflora]|uniref:Uncharacterized protein n=1 Tax=Kingdonia uniflora TaxID=39325 RepID=A0A7J7P9A4_9MAGN|nr:hypothetical protein GIB67_029375 [Kingdonia uniflora]
MPEKLPKWKCGGVCGIISRNIEHHVNYFCVCMCSAITSDLSGNPKPVCLKKCFDGILCGMNCVVQSMKGEDHIGCKCDCPKKKLPVEYDCMKQCMVDFGSGTRCSIMSRNRNLHANCQCKCPTSADQEVKVSTYEEMIGAPRKVISSTKLTFIPPTIVDGKPVVKINTVDFADETKECESMLVGNFVGKRLPFMFVKTILLRLWELKGELEMTTKGISRVGSALGVPLFLDKATEDRKRGRGFARVCVDMGVESTFPKTIQVEMDEESIKDAAQNGETKDTVKTDKGKAKEKVDNDGFITPKNTVKPRPVGTSDEAETSSQFESLAKVNESRGQSDEYLKNTEMTETVIPQSSNKENVNSSKKALKRTRKKAREEERMLIQLRMLCHYHLTSTWKRTQQVKNKRRRPLMISPLRAVGLEHLNVQPLYRLGKGE